MVVGAAVVGVVVGAVGVPAHSGEFSGRFGFVGQRGKASHGSVPPFQAEISMFGTLSSP